MKSPHTIINELDEAIFDATQLLQNARYFKDQDPNVTDEKIMQVAIKRLVQAEFIILELIRDLKIPTTTFDARRSNNKIGL